MGSRPFRSLFAGTWGPWELEVGVSEGYRAYGFWVLMITKDLRVILSSGKNFV